MTTRTALDEAVERLERAAADGAPCPPVRDLIGSADIAAAYRVQSRLIARALAAAPSGSGARSA